MFEREQTDLDRQHEIRMMQFIMTMQQQQTQQMQLHNSSVSVLTPQCGYFFKNIIFKNYYLKILFKIRRPINPRLFNLFSNDDDKYIMYRVQFCLI